MRTSHTWGNQLSAAVSTVNFTPITGWKISARATARATNPEKIPENIGRKSGALRNAFRNPRNAPEKSPEKFSGPINFRDFWETHAWPHPSERKNVLRTFSAHLLLRAHSHKIVFKNGDKWPSNGFLDIFSSWRDHKESSKHRVHVLYFYLQETRISNEEERPILFVNMTLRWLKIV